MLTERKYNLEAEIDALRDEADRLRREVRIAPDLKKYAELGCHKLI